MRRLIAIAAASAAFFMPSSAWAGGSDSPTPYTVTAEGIVFPSPLSAHGHVNVRTDQGSFGLHFDPNNGHPRAAWIGESFLPWSALGISDGCVVWVQVSDYNQHWGEGGQAPVCLTEPSPEPEPSEEPTDEPSIPGESETPDPSDPDGEATSPPAPAPNPDPGDSPSPGPDPTPTESVPADQPEPTRPALEPDSADPRVSPEPVEEPVVEIGTPYVIEAPEPSPTVEVAVSSVDRPELAATGINPALTLATALLITLGIILVRKGLKK